jgi:hypothetical protein
MALSPGDYLTDGTRLYQLLQFDSEGFVLEDCATDELLDVDLKKFAEMKVYRVVTEVAA